MQLVAGKPMIRKVHSVVPSIPCPTLPPQARANVNAKDKKNETPLDLALRKKKVSKCRGKGYASLAETLRVWTLLCVVQDYSSTKVVFCLVVIVEIRR